MSDRVFKCPHCGHESGSMDRDVHAAKTMILIYDHIKIGVDGSKLKRVDFDREDAAAISAATESGKGRNTKMHPSMKIDVVKGLKMRGLQPRIASRQVCVGCR